MITEIKAPKWMPSASNSISIFVAGGISGCPDWQAEFIEIMRDRFTGNNTVTLMNPRRDDFDMSNQLMSAEQIEWEYRHLKKADLVVFWFPKETLCPITLFELGRHSMSGESMVVGCHPEYARRFDVVKQLSLMDSTKHIKVVDSVSALVDEAYEVMKEDDWGW